MRTMPKLAPLVLMLAVPGVLAANADAYDAGQKPLEKEAKDSLDKAALLSLDAPPESSTVPACGEPSSCEAQPPEKVNEFVPTYEFQDVPPGVSVPAGLYVRMNLATGRREARKLRPDETHAKNLKSKTLDKDLPGVPVEAATPMLSEPTQSDAEKDAEARRLQEEREAVYWARKYAKLFKPDDETEIIKQALSKVRVWVDAGRGALAMEPAIKALEHLEDLLHQVDNAVNMVAMGGLVVLSDAISPGHLRRPQGEHKHVEDELGKGPPLPLPKITLSHNQRKIASLALWALGAALQNNQDVKTAATEAGLSGLLVAVLQSNATGGSPAQSRDSPGSGSSIDLGSVNFLRRKALYAVSALLESNRAAQDMFWQVGGASAVGRAWAESLSPNSQYGSDKSAARVLRKALGLTERMMGSVVGPDAALSSRALGRGWAGIPGFCALLQRTLETSADVRAGETALRVALLVLRDAAKQENNLAAPVCEAKGLGRGAAAMSVRFGKREGSDAHNDSELGSLIAQVTRRAMGSP